MSGGFSFCGVDIKQIGLEYVPELENLYVYSPAEYAVYDQTFDGHNGGYYYGAAAQPKEFRLRCLFQSERIDQGTLANVFELFRVGRSGKLIFDRRPWCYYNARVVERPELDLTNYMNGLVTVVMKAYFPFARCDNMYNTHYDKQILTNTGLFEEEYFAPDQSFTSINDDCTLILANPGTELTPVAISVAGNVGEGLEITNVTTGQTCSFVNITSSLTPPGQQGKQDARIVCDALNGKVVRVDNDGNTHPAYLYHEKGFICLASSFPVKREVYIDNVNGTTVKVANKLLRSYKGYYIFIHNSATSGTWYKINEQLDDQTLVLQYAPENTNYLNRTMIYKMNEINVHFKGANPGNLTMLKFTYKPTFA